MAFRGDLTDQTPVQWQCIKCRALWEQPAFIKIFFVCTICNRPYYSGSMLREVKTP